MTRINFENRLLFLSLFSGLPATLAALALLWTGNYGLKLQSTLTLGMIGFWLAVGLRLRERVKYPLQTISNLLACLREEDYSIRARSARGDDALGEALRELNALAVTLREQRLNAIEASALLRKVMGEIDVAVFTFDKEQRLRLVNRAGERLIGKVADQLLGRTASDLGLSELLNGEAPRTLETTFPGGQGRWGIRRSSFREEGRPHQLLVISELSRELREQERQAWLRLLRVLGHELNNSLAPIKSIAGSLETLLKKEQKPRDWENDLLRGVQVIASRAEALNRFMGAYAQLARLPQPRMQTVELASLVRRVAVLETRVKVGLLSGPELNLKADGDQLEQLLINLIRNAADAVLELKRQSQTSIDAGAPEVQISWMKKGALVELWVEDEGPGVANTANLFVPFFTTKPSGTGVGLVLSRQIAEAHGGSLSLENRPKGTGCLARIFLPLK